MTAGVYAIVNTANGRAYIGSSFDIEKRWAHHLSSFKHRRFLPTDLIAAWHESGGVNFKFRILEQINGTGDMLRAAEQIWLDSFDGQPYNVMKKACRAPLKLKRLESKRGKK